MSDTFSDRRIPLHLRPGRQQSQKRRGIAGFRGVVNTQKWLLMSDQKFEEQRVFEASYMYAHMTNEQLYRRHKRVLVEEQPVYGEAQAASSNQGEDSMDPRSSVCMLLLTLFRSKVFTDVHDSPMIDFQDASLHPHSLVTVFSPTHPRNLLFFNAMYLDEPKLYVRLGNFVSYRIGDVTGQIGQLRLLFQMENEQFALLLKAKQKRAPHNHGPKRNERPDQRLMRQLLLSDEERYKLDALSLHLYIVTFQQVTDSAAYDVLHLNHPSNSMQVTHTAELQPDLRSATNTENDYNVITRDFYVQEYFIS